MAKMFFRNYTKSWYVKLDGKFINLGKDEEKAEQKWHELMAFRDPGAVESITVKALLQRYSRWLKRNRAESTHSRRLPRLKSFASMHGKRKAAQLKPYHVRAWVDEYYAERSPTTIHDVMSIIQAAFSWAEDEGLLRRNPIRRMRKPHKRTREDFIPREKWRELLRACHTRELRSVIWFGLATGARAEEIFIIEARHVHGTRIIIPGSQAKGKHRQVPKPRTIYLSPRWAARVKGLPPGLIFRNSDGNPWKKDAVNSAMVRLKRKLKWPALNLTMMRHSFAHDHVRRGTDSLILAKLMGHTDTRMLARVYAHVGAADAVLEAAVSS